MNKTAAGAVLLLFLRVALAEGSELSVLCADRAALERVYHEHRTGTKPPFEEAMPPALLERLVREDAKKKANGVSNRHADNVTIEYYKNQLVLAQNTLDRARDAYRHARFDAQARWSASAANRLAAPHRPRQRETPCKVKNPALVPELLA